MELEKNRRSFSVSGIASIVNGDFYAVRLRAAFHTCKLRLGKAGVFPVYKGFTPPPVGKCTLATWKIGCSRQNGTYQIFDYYSAKIRDKVRFNYFSVLIKWSCFWCHSKLITTIFFSFRLEFKLLSNNCQLKCWKWLTFSWIINSNPKTLRTCTWSCFLKWPTDVRFPIIFAHDIPHSLTL